MATTWSTTDHGAGFALSNANLTITRTSGAGTDQIGRTTASAITGKVYFEVTAGNVGGGNNIGIGVSDASASVNTFLGDDTHSCGIYSFGSFTYNHLTQSNPGTFTTGDVIGVAVDVPNQLIYFAKNNTWILGNPAAGTGGFNLPNITTYFPAFTTDQLNAASTLNPGPTTTYAAPAGFATFDVATGSAVGAAAGTSTAAAVGAATKAAAGASAGTSTATGVGASRRAAAGSATGTSTALATSSTGGSVGTSAGASTALAVGASRRAAAGSAAGTSTAIASSTAQTVIAAIGNAAGMSSAFGFAPIPIPPAAFTFLSKTRPIFANAELVA